jgi:hypothetical protein
MHGSSNVRNQSAGQEEYGTAGRTVSDEALGAFASRQIPSSTVTPLNKTALHRENPPSATFATAENYDRVRTTTGKIEYIRSVDR